MSSLYVNFYIEISEEKQIDMIKRIVRFVLIDEESCNIEIRVKHADRMINVVNWLNMMGEQK